MPNVRISREADGERIEGVARPVFQLPHLAGILPATGDGGIEYTGSGYWNAGRGKGRNWMGRLLELVRSEVAAQRAPSSAQPAP